MNDIIICACAVFSLVRAPLLRVRVFLLPNDGEPRMSLHVLRWLLQVMSALHMIMQKWKSEAVFHDHPDIDPEHVQLRIVMLGKLCGAIIGENGKTIMDIKMATSTEIRVQV
jgi:hypothetical protein